MTRTAFLPVITKARELDARLLLAAALARDGWRTIVGDARRVNELARHASPSTYFSPLLVPASVERLQTLRARGHHLIGWDEEGLVYPNAEWYVGDRLDPDAVATIDDLVTWGPAPTDDLLRVRPEHSTPVHSLGNPRIDLLRPPFTAVFEPAANANRALLGRYLLVNTNFDLVNHADGPDVLVQRLRESGRIRTAIDEERFARWAVFRQSILDSFVEGVGLIAAARPDLHLVIRPHPSEDVGFWRSVADPMPNATVAPAVDGVVPWILGAEAVLHNSCTTAIEAYVLGVPTIAYRPPLPGPIADMESSLPNELSACAADWGGVIGLLDDLIGHRRDADEARRATAHRWIGSLDGPFAAERIASLATSTAPAGSRGSIRSRLRQVRRSIRRPTTNDPVTTTEQRQRFPGLDADEASERADRLAAGLGVSVAVDNLDRDVVVVGPVARDFAGEEPSWWGRNDERQRPEGHRGA